MTEANKARKRRYCDAFNARDTTVFDELFASGYILHIAGSPDICGAAALKALVVNSLRSFPDVRITVHDMIAEGDKVVTRWTIDFTHTAEFMGVPATQKMVSVSGITVDTFANGRIVEAWEVFDQLGMLRQMGAIPPQSV